MVYIIYSYIKLKKEMAIIASISTIVIMNGHNHAMKLHGANMDQSFHMEPLAYPSWTFHRPSDRLETHPFR